MVGRKKVMEEGWSKWKWKKDEKIQTNIEIEGGIQQATNLHGNTALTT